MAISKVTLNGDTLMDVTQDTVAANNLLSGETATGADGEGVTGNIATKTSSNMTVSGATVTAPAGYYATAASKSVASGSASTPATTITANPTISVSSAGLITATTSTTKSVTPTVSAGYVSSGTAGTITVSGSNTRQLTTQAATTITPTTSSQTAVAVGKYTTGAVTVNPIPSQYIVPSGTKTITENGTGIDVTSYASVDVDVAGQAASGVKYIWTDQDGEGAWDVSGYQYCAVDGAPVKDYAHFRYWIRLTPDTGLTVTTHFQSMYKGIIEWGDGTQYGPSTSGYNQDHSHTYSDYGCYVIHAYPDASMMDSYLVFYPRTVGQTDTVIAPINAIIYAELCNVHLQGEVHYDTGGGEDYFLNGINLKKAYFNGYNKPSNTQPYFTFSVVNRCTSLEEIILGENISGIDAYIDISTLTGLRKIRFLSSTPPPTKSATAFTGLTTNCVISVPSGTLSAYTSAANYPDPATYTYIEE